MLDQVDHVHLSALEYQGRHFNHLSYIIERALWTFLTRPDNIVRMGNGHFCRPSRRRGPFGSFDRRIRDRGRSAGGEAGDWPYGEADHAVSGIRGGEDAPDYPA